MNELKQVDVLDIQQRLLDAGCTINKAGLEAVDTYIKERHRRFEVNFDMRLADMEKDFKALEEKHLSSTRESQTNNGEA